MSIAISDDHKALADTAADFLARRDARASARALLENPDETLPSWWGELVDMGWLGLHLPEDLGGSGYGLEELVIVAEQLGRTVAPGPFIPTVIASAVLAAAGGDAAAHIVPGLADGSLAAGIAINGNVTVTGGKASGHVGNVLGGNLAQVIMVPAGDDVVVVRPGEGVTVETPTNLDYARRSSRVSLVDAPAIVLTGAKRNFVDIARVVLAAEAVGVAREATDMAAQYSKDRIQFGRPIAMYQAVKHHCANMAVATELATSAVWDAARASITGGDQFTYAAAVAATLAAPAADLCANLSTQVHGGIAITWEHDLHLYMRRATALKATLKPDHTAEEITALLNQGVKREKSIELPPEAEAIRTEVRAFVDKVKDLDAEAQKLAMVDEGYAVPNWPKPWGRAAGAIEQLVIEQEFGAAGLKKPTYGITGWNILTILQHGNADQIERWARPALEQKVIWCQLFSEPDAGSDAAGIKTKATRVDGGWLVNGQKVWTSGAHVSKYGFATVRTNPDVPKHEGITMMVIDMEAKGVTVRPLKQTSGGADFNEVFFDDVLVPDDDVVGPVDGGWTVARATLGNESVSIGGGDGAFSFPPAMVAEMWAKTPERLVGGAARIGHFAAASQAMGLLNLRSAHRAVAGGEPGPEGAMAKLIVSELGHESAALIAELNGDDTVYLDGMGAIGAGMILMHRGISIAGGTSEIKRNQIGERILGLPRDPLIK